MSEVFDKDSYGTPPEIIEKVRKVFGGKIHIDPFSNETAQKTIKAYKYGTKEKPILAYRSSLPTYVNPPYSRPEICLEFWATGKPVIVLLNSDTSTKVFQRLFDEAEAVCFPRRRIAFIHPVTGVPTKGNRHSQVMFYKGDDPDLFYREFKDLGATEIL